MAPQQHERKESIKELFAAAIEANRRRETEQRLQLFLDDLERQARNFRDPGRERLLVWIRVVRHQRKPDPPHLRALVKAIAGNRWNTDAPAWWPDATPWPSGRQTRGNPFAYRQITSAIISISTQAP